MTYPYDAPASADLFERAAAVTPGGVNSPVRAFRAVGGTPRFMASGSGPWITDVDGKRWADFACGTAVTNLGHNHPAVLEAAHRQLDTLVHSGCIVRYDSIVEAAERTNPNVVKLVGTQVRPGLLRALYFTRATAPWGEGPLFHHVGLYAYRRAALERFVALPASPLEQRERLEQLRALEAGMTIMAGIVDTVPLGVDTPEDLASARRHYNEESGT